MVIKYPQDEWYWFNYDQENWYCSHECAMSDGVNERDLYRIGHDKTLGDESDIDVTCQTCGAIFQVPRSWKYDIRCGD